MNLPTRKLWWLKLNLSNGRRESWLISRLLWGGKVQDWAVLQRQGCGGSMYTLHGVPPDISSTYWNVQSVNSWSSWSYAARRPKTARYLLQPTMMWALPGAFETHHTMQYFGHHTTAGYAVPKKGICGFEVHGLQAAWEWKWEWSSGLE